MKVICSLFIVSLMIVNEAAAQVLYLNEDRLINNAYDIIEGQVIDVIPQWDDDHRIIYSYVTVRVDTAFKGMIQESEIILQEIGGRLDGYFTYVQNAPVFVKDEKILLFLKKEDSVYRTYGMSQGKYNKKERDGGIVLERDVETSDLFTIDDEGIEEVSAPRHYESLKRAIHEGIREQEGGNQ